MTASAPAENLALCRPSAGRRNRQKMLALCLVLPLLLYIVALFVVPIAAMLYRSVDNAVVSAALHNTAEALSRWDGKEVPDEAAFAALALDLKQAFSDRKLGRVAAKLNYEQAGLNSLIMRAGSRVARNFAPPFKDKIIAADPRWANPDLWRIVRRFAQPLLVSNYVMALDLRYKPDGSIGAQTRNRRIYLSLFMRTFGLAMFEAMLCLLLAYPLCYFMMRLARPKANLIFLFVLLPFWTSSLVRTTSWIVLLQKSGVINSLLVFLGLIGDDDRLELAYNMTGTVIAMTYILLPFMVLPLYSVMRDIPPHYVKAARNLGASPAVAFRRVYLPLSWPGIRAGVLLVFIISIGFYITPALIGGRTGQLIGNMIAFHLQESLNWGLAAALGVLLLAIVAVLFGIQAKLFGARSLGAGA